MTRILSIDDFIKESRGADLDMRTPDRFDSDELANKSPMSVYNKHNANKKSILQKIASHITSKYDWLNCCMINVGPSNKEEDLAYVLYISYVYNCNEGSGDSLIPFSDIGINTDSLTPAQWNYLKHIEGIDTFESMNSFWLEINKDVVYDKFKKFIENHENNRDMEIFRIWDYNKRFKANNENLGIIVMNPEHVYCDMKTQEQYAEQAVEMWIEFLRSFFTRIK